jgi:hypothetical protein
MDNNLSKTMDSVLCVLIYNLKNTKKTKKPERCIGNEKKKLFYFHSNGLFAFISELTFTNNRFFSFIFYDWNFKRFIINF